MQFGNTKIGGMSFGSTRIGGAKYGNTLVFSSGGGVQPVMIPYIRGGADGSYIDTGITADSTTRIIVWARNVNPSAGGWSHIFGSRSDSSSNQLVVALPYTANMGKIFVGYANTTAYSSDAFEYLSGYHKYELYGGSLSVDDVIVATASANSFSNSQNIYLFGANSGGTLAKCMLPVDICACKIYKNNVLVRDYTAVNSPSVGLFDSVSNTLFTNAGSGSFTYGSFNQNAYTPLEYIGCTAEQYFDTGLYGSESTKVVTKFRPTGTAKTYHRLFGTRNSVEGNTLMLELMLGNESYVNRYFYLRYKATNTTVYSAASQTNSDLVYVHDENVFTLYKNNSQLGTKTVSASSFTTTYTMYVGDSNYSGGGLTSGPFYGYIYYIGFGADKNFVPAKVNNVAGMYDTYNDVFYPSASGTAFIAGPEL